MVESADVRSPIARRSGCGLINLRRSGFSLTFSRDPKACPTMIDPRVASGLRDLPPAVMIPRERMLASFRQTFASFGFVPIETPHIERMEVLTGKGAGSEEVLRQIFEVTNKGGTPGELALRFDLTVPLARFVAKHIDELGVPFKRYAIGSVFRGERPAKGRFREFAQCDFDTIGTESPLADAETAQVIFAALSAAGVPEFTITLNNRKILDGFLESLRLAGRSGPVLRALDKLAKIGRDAVVEELKRGGRDRRSWSQRRSGSPGSRVRRDRSRRQRGLAESRGDPGLKRNGHAGHRQPANGHEPAERDRCPNRAGVDRPGPGARARLLHGHRIRDDDQWLGEVWQRGVGRALRQPRQPVHAAAAAGRGCLDRSRPPPGIDGRGRLVEVIGEHRPCAGGEFSGDRSHRARGRRGQTARSGHRCRGISRPDPDRQANGLRLDARP